MDSKDYPDKLYDCATRSNGPFCHEETSELRTILRDISECAPHVEPSVLGMEMVFTCPAEFPNVDILAGSYLSLLAKMLTLTLLALSDIGDNLSGNTTCSTWTFVSQTADFWANDSQNKSWSSICKLCVTVLHPSSSYEHYVRATITSLTSGIRSTFPSVLQRAER